MKYYGKEKCRILKEIRAEIAKQNDIAWTVAECKHKGNCRGTCPKCEQEVRELEEALAQREALGKKVAVVGISAAMSLSVTGCFNPLYQTTDGIMPPESDELSAGGAPIGTEEVQTEVSMGELAVTETEAGEILVDGLMGAPLPPDTVEETDPDPETDPDESEVDTSVIMGEPILGEFPEEEFPEGEP